MPLDLIEDISRGRSWLFFARDSKALEEAGSLAYEHDESPEAEYGEMSESGSSGRLSARRPGKKYPGKTYDSVESIEEFFRKRAARMGGHGAGSDRVNALSPKAKIQSPANSRPLTPRPVPQTTDILPGSYVRHPKYGRGLVLRREGSGDQTKFTVSFPGYGQKKLIEKYANLEKG
jgi:DNA helicase-2/ATP-dependent DNA helicase PcrA